MNFRLLPIALTILFSYGFSTLNSLSNKNTTTTVQTDIPVYNFDELEPLLYTDSKKTYIINFWAMWCGPCIKELPHFQEYQKNNPDVEIIFVSLDFPKDIESRLKPFLKKKGITSKVVLLDDPDSNTWINKIDPNWSGAIPFTIIFNNKERSFHERAFESAIDIEKEVLKTINK